MMVRNLLPGERLDSVVVTGFEQLPMDNDWCWHAIMDDVIVGSLICAPAHGAVILLRLVIHQSAPVWTFRSIVRTMFAETRARGYAGYIALIGPMRPKELRMMNILRRIGGAQMTEPTVLVYGESPVVS
jgi:hypothetical protein